MISYAGTNPRSSRFAMRDDVEEVGIIVSLNFTSPQLLEISVGGEVRPTCTRHFVIHL